MLCNVVFCDCRECWTRARRILHTSDAVLEFLSPFLHLCTTHTPVTILNSHPTMNLYRFHAFAKQKSHDTSLLLLSALFQGHRHLVDLLPRFLCVPTPSIGSSRSPPSHTLHTVTSVAHAIFNTTFPVSHWTGLVLKVLPSVWLYLYVIHFHVSIQILAGNVWSLRGKSVYSVFISFKFTCRGIVRGIYISNCMFGTSVMWNLHLLIYYSQTLRWPGNTADSK
jgi:hypothetical protein